MDYLARSAVDVKLRRPSGSGRVAPMHISLGEVIMLVVIVLIVFSASRMSTLGNALGKFVYSFKKASKGSDLIDVTPKHLESRPRRQGSEREP